MVLPDVRTEFWVEMMIMEPCPFCGGSAKIVLCDDEGNLHDEDYALRPYSGVGFKIRHTHEENPQCPIARYEVDGGIVGGVYIYDTKEQAAEAWNRRERMMVRQHEYVCRKDQV